MALTPSTAGSFVTETLDYDGGRQVTVYVPPDPPEAVVFAGDHQIFGAVFCASPGAGFQPPVSRPGSLPKGYFVAGDQEPFFHVNATRWAAAFREAGADVVMTERVGSHGDAFWRQELPRMVAWAFGR